MHNNLNDSLANSSNVLSAVILSYNRCEEVLLTIEKLKKYRESLPFVVDIIVVDNASIDETYFQVSQQHPDITCIKKEKNNGIAGWNDGFNAVKSKYILVLDDDSCIEMGLAEAIEYLEVNTNIGILALDIVDAKLQGDPHLDAEKAWKHKQHVVGFIGCGALIRTETYKKIGGFAEWIYLYTHEFEYSIRCLNAGYDVVFFNKALVVHRTSSLNRSVKRLRIFSTRNEMAIIYRYFSTNKLKFLFRTFINNLKFIKRDGIKSGWYTLLGGIEFLKLARNLPVSPVNKDIQNFYSDYFWSTQPVFNREKNFYSTQQTDIRND